MEGKGSQASATAGSYDDSHLNLGYVGASWSAGTGWSKAYNSTVSYSNSKGAKVWFAFNGSRITRRYTKAHNRTNVKIYIDGTERAGYDDSSPYTLWQVSKTWTVNAGEHIIEVRSNSAGDRYMEIDALIVDIPTVGVGNYDDRHAQVQYIGNWTASSPWPSAYNQTLNWTNTTENAVNFTFEGNQIKYYFTRAINRGFARVTIDGVFREDVNMYTDPPLFQQSVTYGGLGAGVHTSILQISMLEMLGQPTTTSM